MTTFNHQLKDAGTWSLTLEVPGDGSVAAFNRLAGEMEKLRESLVKMEEEWLELEMLREELEG